MTIIIILLFEILRVCNFGLVVGGYKRIFVVVLDEGIEENVWFIIEGLRG